MTDSVVSTTGDPSIDYALPGGVNVPVTVEGLDTSKYPQGSMVASHGLRLPSHAPYLDHPEALGQDTTEVLTVPGTAEGFVTSDGQFHTNVLATDVNPYEPVANLDDTVAETEGGVNADGEAVNAQLHLDAPVQV